MLCCGWMNDLWKILRKCLGNLIARSERINLQCQTARNLTNFPNKQISGFLAGHKAIQGNGSCLVLHDWTARR